MSYATEKTSVGREPVTVVELDLDTCSLTYGTLPCTASGASGSECYNTRATCQDVTNFTTSTKIYRFIEQRANMPVGQEMFPALQGVALAPGKITEGFGLGYRASVTVTLQDFTHHDRGIDPYVATRSYTPSDQGTFFGKLRARTPYYQGRVMRIRTGYMGTSFDWANFQDREYIIEEIRGPDLNGRVQVIGKDVLKLADDERARCPAASEGELLSDLSIFGTDMAIVGGTYNDPATTGDREWVRIGDEIIEYTALSGAGTAADPWLLTGLDRNDLLWGTTGSDHSAEDSVQQCKAWQSVNVRDIIDELLVTYAEVPSGYINATQWDDEEGKWLSTYNLTTIISEPTGVDTLISELQEQCRVNIWWDDVNQTIPLSAITPPFGNAKTILNDSANIIADTLKIKDNSKDRVSRVYFYYGMDDYTQKLDEVGNMRRLYIQADTDAETADQYGDTRIKQIHSRWFDTSLTGPVTQTASRMLSTLRNVPREISFSLDAKDGDATAVGDVRDIEASLIQGADGALEQTRIMVQQVKEGVPGHRFDYVGITGISSGPFGFIGPDTLTDYTLEDAADQLQYGFISNSSGLYSNSDTGHKII